MSEQQQPAVNLAEIINKYIDLRDAVARVTKRAADECKPMQESMKAIETYLMDLFNKTGQKQIGTERGTAFLTTKTGCNIEDRDLYWGWLMEAPAERRALLTLSANKTGVAEYIEKGDGTAPPGLKWTVMKDIQIRRS